MGMPYPEKEGGAGADYVSYVIAIEEISRACASTGIIVSAHTSLATWPIFKFGTQAQKDQYLHDMASGRRLGAFALTEPGAGTDAGAGTATATPHADGYALNGSKMFITNAPFADVYIVFAKTDPERGTRGMSAFIVEKDTPGFSVGEAEHKLGIRGSARRPSTSPTAASRRTRCWARRARASRSPCRRSTAGGSASPRRRSASPRGRSTRRSPTRRNVSSSASRSRPCRPSSG